MDHNNNFDKYFRMFTRACELEITNPGSMEIMMKGMTINESDLHMESDSNNRKKMAQLFLEYLQKP